MSAIYGFTLESETRIPEIESTARLWRHGRTGARLLSLLSPDENKVFGISFRTPPRDSTGVAHILEHSVLCGSRKYPVKEPFVELIKGSLNTFLNAFTYPDKTCYPVASTNLRDFYNLIDVYLDAVFHPLIDGRTLAQEGWHHEPRPEAEGGGAFYKGVVFNEMKGVYSSPDSILGEASQQGLFPDVTYGLDSGGDPAVIPELTVEAFLDFHRTYYHPSNAWIFFSGDDPEEERLKLLDAVLSPYTAQPVDSAIADQPRLKAPRWIEKPFPAGEDEQRGQVTVNWLLPETTDAEANLALRILEHALVGMPSSPLRKALIDSGLGEDLAGVGLETELRWMYFSTGLKGVDPAKAAMVEALIFDTLRFLAESGLERDVIAAALNTIEFRLRENNTGRYPRGLSLMLRSLSTWLYDGDPLALLAFEAPLEAVKKRIASGEPVLENLIRAHFLENSHQTTVVLKPDPALAGQRDAAERGRLDAAWTGMSDDERAAVAAEAEELRRRQEAPDSPAALASIPRLTLADLPRAGQVIPQEVVDIRGVRALLHDLPTSRIAYVDVGLDLSALPKEYLPCVPLFGRALLEMGTRRDSFVALTRRIARATGGIEAQPFVGPVRGAGSATAAAWLFLRGKATVDNAGELLEILREVLTEVRLNDRERFAKMVLEEKARMEQRLIPAGHQLVSTRIKAAFSAAAQVSELMHGVEQLHFLRKLASAVEKDWPGVLKTLGEMRELLVRKGGLLLNVTLDAESTARIRPQLEAFCREMPERDASPAAWTGRTFPPAEGFAVPAQVNYVGKGVDLSAHGYAFKGSHLVASRLVRTAYLWDRVRVQGGAYGAFCTLDSLTGHLAFVSYRDPNLDRTLAAYDEAAAFLASPRVSNDELEKAVIGTIGDIDAHMLPDAKGFTALARTLQNIDEDWRQQLRDSVLAASRQDFAEFAAALGALRHARVVVLGGREALEKSAAGLRVVNLM